MQTATPSDAAALGPSDPTSSLPGPSGSQSGEGSAKGGGDLQDEEMEPGTAASPEDPRDSQNSSRWVPADNQKLLVSSSSTLHAFPHPYSELPSAVAERERWLFAIFETFFFLRGLCTKKWTAKRSGRKSYILQTWISTTNINPLRDGCQWTKDHPAWLHSFALKMRTVFILERENLLLLRQRTVLKELDLCFDIVFLNPFRWVKAVRMRNNLCVNSVLGLFLLTFEGWSLSSLKQWLKKI